MEKLKNYELSNERFKEIVGGRRVVKVDANGDGRWDIKWVYRNNGSVRIKIRQF